MDNLEETVALAFRFAQQFNEYVYVFAAGTNFVVGTKPREGKSHLEIRPDGSCEATGAMCLIVDRIAATELRPNVRSYKPESETG